MEHIEVMPSNDTIDVKYHKGPSRFFMHIHNHYEIYLSLSDHNNFFVGQKIYDVNRYDIFLFNNTDVHKFNTSSPEDCERYVVMFPPNLFTESDPETASLLDCFNTKIPYRNHKLPLPVDKQEIFIDILQKMLELKIQGGTHSCLKLRLYLTQLLLLIEEIQPIENELHLKDTYENDDARIKATMKYIQENCEYPLTLDSISKEVYLNKYYLCRLFKNKLGFGINDYIKACRLNNSIALLREGIPVATVALKTGFGSVSYFIHTFKTAFGTSPKKYMQRDLIDGL